MNLVPVPSAASVSLSDLPSIRLPKPDGHVLTAPFPEAPTTNQSPSFIDTTPTTPRIVFWFLFPSPPPPPHFHCQDHSSVSISFLFFFFSLPWINENGPLHISLFWIITYPLSPLCYSQKYLLAGKYVLVGSLF